MSRRVRLILFVALGIAVTIAIVLLLLYMAARHEPAFYRRAMEIEPAVLEKASDRMLQQATALASAVKHEGHWEALFTAEQINGWLAVDMARNHSDLLPASLSDPRVAIEPERMRIACRLDRGNWRSVLSLSVDVYLAEPDVIAVRIREARAGALPLPLQGILDRISEEANQTDVEVRWLQAEGDPVAEIPIPPLRDAKGKVIRIETLQLGEGKVYLSGVTERR